MLPKVSDLPNNSEIVSIGGDLPMRGVLKGRQEHGAATVRQIPLLRKGLFNVQGKILLTNAALNGKIRTIAFIQGGK